MNVKKFENEIEKIVDEIDDVEIKDINYNLSLNECIIKFNGININYLILDQQTIESNNRSIEKRKKLINQINELSIVENIVEFIDVTDEIEIKLNKTLEINYDEFNKLIDNMKCYL